MNRSMFLNRKYIAVLDGVTPIFCITPRQLLITEMSAVSIVYVRLRVTRGNPD